MEKIWGVELNEKEREYLEQLFLGPIDIVSVGTGQMYKRYGFVYVDRHDDNTGDYSRRKKDSFYWYKK